MNLLLKCVSFISVIPGKKPLNREDLSEIGSHYWWFIPLFESVVYLLITLLCIAVNYVLVSPFLSAAIFIAFDHCLHGLRRLDGFADLSEGIFYKLMNPGIKTDDVWPVVRSPGIGVFGTAVIVIYLLLQWNLLSEAMRLGNREFLLTVMLTALMTKVSLIAAVTAPGKFRKKSIFDMMAGEMAKPGKIFLTGVTTLLLAALIIIAAMQGTGYLMMLPLLFILAAAAGLWARVVILKLLKMLNGDIIGFAWCTSEILVYMCLLFIWKLWFKAG